jgi:hypothetical protein
MKKIPLTFWVFVAAILLLIIFSWLRAIRDSRSAPHWISYSVNGKEFAGHWTTNPVYFSFVWETNLTATGVVIRLGRQTNYYWRK